MRLGDLLFFQLTWYDLFDLVLQAQGYNGDIFGIDGRRREMFAAGGWQDWSTLDSEGSM